MDKVLKLYKLVDGVEKPFPNSDEQIITSDFTYTAKRMGGAPTITCTMRHKDNLDALWDENVYAVFNGERYYLHRTPTNTYDNTDVRYKYDVELVSERIILDSVYFIDVDPLLNYKGVTNSPSFSFHGNVVDFAKKLNYALQYAKLQSKDGTQGYIVSIDDNTTIGSEKYIVNFDNKYISSAIQEIYNTFKLPYYFKGKEIHIGESDVNKKLDTVLKYGDTESLLSISKQNANHMVVNRITGVGSSDNIPYYYPNLTPLGEVNARAIQSNMTLEDKDFIVVNSEKLTRLGLKEEGDDGNVVVLKKYETNAVVNDNDKEYNISIFDYLYSDTNGTKVWNSAQIGNFYLAAYPYEGGSSGSNNKKMYSYKYHVRLKFKVSKNQGGMMRWMWKANPNFDSISEQKRKYGNFIEKFFDNLEAYEVVDNKERKIDINMVGAYPNLYLDTPFLGSSNGKGRDVEIHIKFEFSKQALNNQILVSDIQNTTFTSISLLKEDVGDNPYYWESPKAAYSDIREFGVDLTDNAKNLFLTNPEKLKGDGFFLEQKKWIAPQTNLMPPIYRNSDGTDRFYNAENFKYPVIVDGEEKGYYQFPNPYIDGNPHEYIQNFDDIKPTIEGMVNGHGDAINTFSAFAYDEGDNDSVDKDGNLLHPYFFAKLRTFDQSAEFNLFDHAIENGPMQITMTSGQCSGCTFQIMVNKDTQKNTVQVDSSGNLVRDDKGNVVVVGTPQDRQNDTINNTVWIALHKDVDTLPSVMPNMGSYNKPLVGDTFAILNISLPQAYIESAEKRLETALLEYMQDNNVEKFNFSVKFSRIYLGEHPDVLAKITENSSVSVLYNGATYPLHISSYTYKMKSGDVLPEITVELTDTLSIHQGAIQHAVSQVKDEILNAASGVNAVKQCIPYFLRKDIDDQATGRISFANGFASSKDASFGGFKENSRGAGIFQDASGNWHIEADFMRVRKKLSATTVEIEESHHIGGSQMLTSASAVIDYVIDKGSFYRCYFLKTDESGRTVRNKWEVGDQAYCRYFNLTNDTFYWRKVINTNYTTTDSTTIEIDGVKIFTAKYHFVDLSETICAEGSDVPRAQDNIVQLGYQSEVAEGEEDPNASRKNAIIMAGAGEGSPYICQYVGINSFELPAPQTQIKPNDNVFTGKFEIQSGSTGLANTDEWTGLQASVNEISNTATQAKASAEAAQKTADDAKGKAEDAEKTATDAAKDAKDATDTLATWADDGVISPLEKQGIKDEYAFVTADKTDIDNQSVRYGIKNKDGEEEVYTLFENAYVIYTKDLEAIIDAAPDAVVNIPTDMPTHQTDYYNARTSLLARIAELANKVANDAQIAAKEAQEVANAVDATVETLKGTVGHLGEDVSTINKRLDGVVENYFLGGAPTFDNEPAKSWLEAGGNEPLNHVGDTYTNINTLEVDDKGNVVDSTAGHSWRWCYCTDETLLKDIPYEEIEIDGTKYKFHWHPIADSDAVKALLEAKGAKDLADGKRRIFVNEPRSPYDEGDMWAQGSEGDIKICTQSRSEEGKFYAEDWKLASKYTDDTLAKAVSKKIDNFIADEYEPFISDIKTQVDKKAQTWYQSKAPSDGWDDNEKSMHVGDLWYDTANKKNFVYALDNNEYVWQEIDGVPQEVFDAIDGKSSIFFGDNIPALPWAKGDIWSKGIKGSLLVCKQNVEANDENETTKEELSKTCWIEADDTTILIENSKNEQQNYTDGKINGLLSGTQNLVRNSGFTGSYESIGLQGGQSLHDALEMYTPSLEGWVSNKVVAEKSDISQTGKQATISSGGSLAQSLTYKVYKSKPYTLSFCASGSGTMEVTFAGRGTSFVLSDEWKKYTWITESASENNELKFSLNGSYDKASIWDIMLTEGNIASDWALSPLDNRSTMAKIEEAEYLKNLFKVNLKYENGTFTTGITNTGLIQMANYNNEGVIKNITGGMNGTYLNDDSVAFFAGGDLEMAIKTVGKFKGNPNYEPTTEELASMAKAVITHGGRAILQDIILRGYVYAEGGVFNGKVYAEEGVFNGTVYAEDGTFKGRVEATEGVFNGTIVGQSKYGNCTIGIDKENAKSGQEIFHVTSPLRYTANGEPIEDGEYYSTLSFKQEHYFGAGYLVLHLNAFNTSSTELSGWHFSATEDSVDGGTDKVVVRGSSVNIANSDTDKSVEMSPNFFTVKNAACRLFTNTIQLDVDKLPTSSNGLLRGQLYLDGNTLKIKT